MSRRKNAGKGYGMMFHGNFATKAAAKSKEREVHGFIRPRIIKGKRRYMVMTERKNPIQRKKNPPRFGGVSLTDEQRARLAAGRAAGKSLKLEAKVAKLAQQAAKRGDLDAFNRHMQTLRMLEHEERGGNPHELMIMGANPHGNDREISLPAGATIVIRTPRSNPSAESIRESFTGTPVEWETTLDEPHMAAGDYAQLGEVLALYVKPHHGEQVQTIKFARSRPLLVTDESARQLYFVGGDQDVTESLSAFNPHHRGGNIHELGELRRIDYKQRKEHVRNPELDEWKHYLGEETGERPRIVFDANSKRLLLEGGAYVIRPEGIVN